MSVIFPADLQAQKGYRWLQPSSCLYTKVVRGWPVLQHRAGPAPPLRGTGQAAPGSLNRQAWRQYCIQLDRITVGRGGVGTADTTPGTFSSAASIVCASRFRLTPAAIKPCKAAIA